MNFLLRLYRNRVRMKDLNALSGRLAAFEAKLDKLEESCSFGSPVVIEHAGKVVIERVVYSNHFGTLDIDQLSGQLNIGVNCRTASELPAALAPFTKKPNAGPDGSAAPSAMPSGGPVCNIRSRT